MFKINSILRLFVNEKKFLKLKSTKRCEENPCYNYHYKSRLQSYIDEENPYYNYHYRSRLQSYLDMEKSMDESFIKKIFEVADAIKSNANY